MPPPHSAEPCWRGRLEGGSLFNDGNHRNAARHASEYVTGTHSVQKQPSVVRTLRETATRKGDCHQAVWKRIRNFSSALQEKRLKGTGVTVVSELSVRKSGSRSATSHPHNPRRVLHGWKWQATDAGCRGGIGARTSGDRIRISGSPVAIRGCGRTGADRRRSAARAGRVLRADQRQYGSVDRHRHTFTAFDGGTD